MKQCGAIEAMGGVAQLGEHLLCKQGVIGSIPFTSTKNTRTVEEISALKSALICSIARSAVVL